MTILILPDCHLNWRVQDKIYQYELPDKVVHAGDIFDQYFDSPELNAQAAKWFKKRLYDPKWIFVKANHDRHYTPPLRTVTCCSGFSEEKYKAINKVLIPEDWARQKWYHIENNILFTHAGLSSTYVENGDIKQVEKNLIDDIDHAERELDRNRPYWLYNAGRSRGGKFPVGGILWCDVNEFKATKGLCQIFGHTPDGPKFIDYNNKQRYIEDGEKFDLRKGGNFMLDSREGWWYGLIEDNILTVKRFDWASELILNNET